MNYAVIQTGGKQYKVSEGEVIEVERLPQKAAETVVFDNVLLAVADADVKIGTPTVSGMTVTAEVIASVRGPKIRVAKFKAKSRYRRVTGHRQELSQLRITQIGGVKPKKAEIREEKPAEVKKASIAKKKTA
jgi:large subunit ribosomal protein L21